ncbi:MAG: hypothetical protein QF513_03065 [Gammaproteobacteria bacterium]|jgi:hypothetical protein|nr:hypothetical protein [Gammaproteobacteria bacterium]MBQ08619.1 hypothetical protein [Gammaproteobacteria bacterium]MDP6146756.1 hypothetical protein [Gammaproteobacteria bacterium]HJM09377.1 hypothetical protein [Gammaproteobacteria bacterium]HJN00326.1 hypothetical protein [Gammaproteobacteria bacterium]|tara:strand:+ start:13390 stop:14142 length:753 start_codon:yes stop_codon:yes gene_type:complete
MNKNNSSIVFTVSARGKNPRKPIFSFLRENYGELSLNQIESVFGFGERSTLYGGRFFQNPELSDRDVRQLNNAGIGFRIPLTNHFADYDEYKINTPLISKYHHELNSIICTNDELAEWLRTDFPKFNNIEASVIKNINNSFKLNKALKIFTCVVLPMVSNDDLDFLSSIEDKKRIRLFANGGCAYTCPSKICYRSQSKLNKFKGGDFKCSQLIKERELMGMIDFDLKVFIDMGYTKFKLLRSRPGLMTGF